MTEEQTSVAEEVEEEPQAASETTGAQEEDLDELLKDFEAAEETPSETTDETPDVGTLHKELKALKEAQQRREVEAEINTLSQQIRGDLPADVFDDRLMRAYVESRAQEDPRLQTAFLQRGKSPTAWNNVVKGLAKEFQGKFSSLPDRQATEDRDAVESAVRSVSNKATERDSEISHEKARHMTDDQLEEYLKQHS